MDSPAGNGAGVQHNEKVGKVIDIAPPEPPLKALAAENGRLRDRVADLEQEVADLRFDLSWATPISRKGTATPGQQHGPLCPCSACQLARSIWSRQ